MSLMGHFLALQQAKNPKRLGIFLLLLDKTFRLQFQILQPGSLVSERTYRLLATNVVTTKNVIRMQLARYVSVSCLGYCLWLSGCRAVY
jgi:hypothetical protein